MKKTIIILSVVLVSLTFRMNAQVAINNDSSLPDPSSMLDVKSDTAGILIPRMTSAQRDAINNPAQGLLVFVTDDNTFYYFDSSAWQPISSGGGNSSSYWNLNGTSVSVDSLYAVVIGKNNTTGTFEVSTQVANGTYTADQCTGGTATAQESYGTYTPDRIFDNSTGTEWISNGSLPVWIQYDFGAGNEKIINKYRLYYAYTGGPRAWEFLASNDGANWTTLDTQSNAWWNGGSWLDFPISNTQAYRFYRLKIYANWDTGNTILHEMEMMTGILDSYPALYVKDDHTGIGTDSPTATLDVNGTFKLVDGNQGNGKILGSDASGNATWQTAANLGIMDKDFLKAGTTDVPTDINDDIYTKGNVVIGKDNTTGNFEVSTQVASGYTADQCTGGTVTAQEYQNPYTPDKLFDDNTGGSSLWRNNNTLPVWVQYDFGAGNKKTIVKYRLYWSGGNTDFTPYSWEFQGSNDGTNWTTLNYQSTQDNWVSGEWREYTFFNTQAYQIYRLNITDNNGQGSTGVYLNEMEMLETSYSAYPGLYVKDDRTGIGTDSPTATLDVSGTFKLTDGTEGSGKVLTSDAAGNASWAEQNVLTNTLDQAYDQGGAGAGKNITADAGAVRVNGRDGFLVTGIYSLGNTIDTEVTGGGTRMFFNPKKAAFRAGYIDGNQWDNANIGGYSIAMGYNSKASEVAATAIGYSTLASGYHSTAIGDNASASGYLSTAIGVNTTASGSMSIAIGDNTTASGEHSTTLGKNTTALGRNAIAMGYSTIASALGSTAMGNNTQAFSFRETAIGSYNTEYTPSNTDSWDASDRLFVIGNGQNANNKSDALIVYKNGNTELHEKLIAPLSGDADLKPYIYGYLNGASGSLSIDNNKSSNGFNVTKIAAGKYRISLTESGVTDYVVTANAVATNNPRFVTFVINSDSFDIYIWKIDGTLIDSDVSFVVYKK